MRYRRGAFGQLGKSLFFLVLVSFVCAGSGLVASAATVTTNLPDYPPGDTVWITGTGFASKESVEVVVEHVDTTITGGLGHDPWRVKASNSGNFTTYWVIPYDDNVGETLRVEARGLSSGLLATTTFTDVNSVLTFASVPETVFVGDTVNIVANLKQNCGGGPDQPLVSDITCDPAGEPNGGYCRFVLFFGTEGNCGVDVAQVSPDSDYTDTLGNAYGQLVFPSPGNFGIRIKFRGEDKPDPCPDTGNSACDPLDPSSNKRCVAISSSNECRTIVVIDTGCSLPVISCPPNSSRKVCADDTICVPISATGSGTVCIKFPNGDSICGTGFVSGNFCFDPDTAGSYKLTFIAKDSCGADTCMTTVSVTLNNPPQFIICPIGPDPLLCPGDSVCVWVHAVDADDDSICITQLGDCPASFVGGSGPGGSSLCGDSSAFGYFCLIPDTSGTYCCTLVVTDPCGAKDTCTFCIVVVVNEPPVVSCPTNDTFFFSCTPETVCVGPFTCTDPDNNQATEQAFINGTPVGIVNDSICFLPSAMDSTYAVKFICTDSCGLADTCVTLVTVKFINQPPVVTCPANDTFFLCQQQSICVKPFTCTDPNNNIASRSVSFGTLNGDSVCFTPTAGKDTTYCIQHVCVDSCGAADTCVTCVTVKFNDPPTLTGPADKTVAVCALPANICVGPFTCTDPDNNLLSKSTNKGSFVGDTVCYTATGSGPDTIIVTCSDSCGAIDKDTVIVTKTVNQPPVAACPANKTIFLCQQQTVCVKPFTCTDPNNNLASSSVNFGTLSGDSVCFTPVANKDTTYCIQLICVDSCGAADTCLTCVTVNFNDPPVVSCPPNDTFDFLCTADTICIYPFTCSDPNNNIASRSVSMGTLTGDTVCFLPLGSGNFTITHICVDSCGKADTCQTTVTVRFTNNPPMVTANDGTKTLCGSGTIDVIACATDPDIGDIITLEKLSGPGPSCVKTGPSPQCCTLTVPVTPPDTLVFVFKVTNGCGATDFDTATWIVNSGGGNPDLSAPDTVRKCPGDTAKFTVNCDDQQGGQICLKKVSGPGTFPTVCGNAPLNGQFEYIVPAEACETVVFACSSACGIDYDTTIVCGDSTRCAVCIYVKIGCVEGDPGQTLTVPVYIQNNVEIGGFDLVLEFFNTDMSVISVQRGDAIDDTDNTGKFNWHYFTYRLDPSTVIHKYKIHLVGIGRLYHYSNGLCLPPSGGYVELVKIKVVLANDELLRCFKSPIYFEWDDFTCLENVFSDCSGETLYVNSDLSQFDPVGICSTDAKTPIDTCVVFENGCVQFRCPHDVDPIIIGDINVNGQPYEIADAVLFSSYFIYGESVFSSDYDTRQAQIGATDVNRDGFTLSIADLVYLLRIITGDQAPLGEGTSLTTDLNNLASFDGKTLELTAVKAMGAVLFVFDGEGIVTSLVKNLTVISNSAQGQTRVLVYSLGKNAVIQAGTTELFSVRGNVELVKVEAADYHASPLDVQIVSSAASKPTSYNLSQNYPNPFNATTTISFSLPADGEVNLKVYNLTGQMVKTYDEFMTAGHRIITWDGTNDRGEKVASGIYFYRLEAAGFTDIKKMTLLK